jgi:hypothetical protein
MSQVIAHQSRSAKPGVQTPVPPKISCGTKNQEKPKTKNE